MVPAVLTAEQLDVSAPKYYRREIVRERNVLAERDVDEVDGRQETVWGGGGCRLLSHRDYTTRHTTASVGGI